MFSKTMLRFSGNYKTPQYEEAADIISYCDRAGVDYNELWMAKNEDSQKFLSENFILTIPRVLVFDKRKSNITVEEGKGCVGTMMYFLNDTTIKQINTNDTLLYYRILENCKVLKVKSDTAQADYYVISTWTKYLPKFAEDLFNKVNDQKASGKTNASYILLNMDFPK